MRLTVIVPLAVLAVAGVLAGAVWGLQYERKRLLADFAAAQQEVARQLTADLGEELQDLEDDARLVATLVNRARDRAVLDAHAEQAFVRSGFDALATVVRHYRAIALYGAGEVTVKSVDPAEAPELDRAFTDWTAEIAQLAVQHGRPLLEGPRDGPDGRQFFIFGWPTRERETVVLVSEARLFLQPVLRSRAPNVQYFLVDPSRSVWLGCAQVATCRAFGKNEWPSIPGLASIMSSLETPGGHAWSQETVSSNIGLPGRPAVIAWDSSARAGERWTVGIVASARAIDARERSLLWWLIGTSTALALALGAVGVFIVAHQRRAVALQERLRNAQEVAYLRERTEKLVENVSAGLIAVTRAGKVVLTNRFLTERVLSVDQGADVAEVLSDGDVTAAARFRQEMEEALRTGRPGFLPGDEVRAFASKPGHFDVRIIPLKQPAEDVSALVLVEDLSELKSLEKQLVRAEKLGTVGVLTAGLAHEIGTPLGIIRGRAEVMLGKLKDPAVGKDVEAVIRQIDQIGSTIRQVLDFARTQPVELRAVMPQEAIENALAMLDWRLRQKSIFFHVDSPSSLPAIAADPDQLQQVLVNLLINACDACEKNGSIKVRANVAEAGTKVAIEIADDGCGIAAENLNAVFDPFFTTKKPGEGTGLGLPVASSIVRNHHGEITLASRKDIGTTVTVRWPVAGERRTAHA